ncbi:MAG: MBL fold metallo-hydrolase [Marinobacter sp.]|uniref:MBL fold metallo-hydrolase n=1 Tax=unclassified Marinobacter TaxID=83889 RepID=UPI0032968391
MHTTNRSVAQGNIINIAPPKFGELVSISAGLLWTRLTIPSKLDHINIYLIKDKGGWFAIDSGPSSDANREIWEEIVQKLPEPKKLTGLLVTHCHPDHIGLSGWIQQHFQVPVYASENEISKARRDEFSRLSSDHEKDDFFYRTLGVSNTEIPELMKYARVMDNLYGLLPEKVKIIEKGESIIIGENDWDIWSGSGHSVEHICLKNDKLGIFISGDQVLPGITPHVGTDIISLNDNPIKNWLESLTDLKSWVNPDYLVLPAHERIFFNAIARVDEILEHHHNLLRTLIRKLDQWLTTDELLSFVGWGAVKGFGRCLALEETFAHLVFLVNSGEVKIQKNESSDAIEFRSILVEK